jgi:GDP-L-fucose synthase
MVLKILITGCSGFIGKNLAEYFHGRYKLYCPNHMELDLTNDIAVRDVLIKYNPDVVIHAATHNATATSTKDLNLVLDANLRMFLNLEKCCSLYGKMLYFGSGAEYDRREYIPLMTEDYFGNSIPKDSYGFSKYIMTKITEQNSNIYNLRLFGVYGKYEDWRIRFISNNICRCILDLPLSVNKNVFFDYLYIDDLCKITEWFVLNQPSHKCYNVCTGSPIDLYSIANEIKLIGEKDLPVKVKESGYNKEYTGSNQRILSEIKGVSFSDRRKSMEKLYIWYKENIFLIDRDSSYLK